MSILAKRSPISATAELLFENLETFCISVTHSKFCMVWDPVPLYPVIYADAVTEYSRVVRKLKETT